MKQGEARPLPCKQRPCKGIKGQFRPYRPGSISPSEEVVFQLLPTPFDLYIQNQARTPALQEALLLLALPSVLTLQKLLLLL